MMNTPNPVDCDQILDTALHLAADKPHWEQLQLYEVADKLGISLALLKDCYGQKDSLTDALFDRADHAVLEHCSRERMSPLSMRQRLYLAITTWLDTLAPHHRTVRQMLKYKLEFGHVHLQLLGLMRISRTVQWIRQVCICDASDGKRIIEEVVLSGIYLATFNYWLWDESDDQQRTRNKLDRLLQGAEKGARGLDRLWPPAIIKPRIR